MWSYIDAGPLCVNGNEGSRGEYGRTKITMLYGDVSTLFEVWTWFYLSKYFTSAMLNDMQDDCENVGHCWDLTCCK